VLILAARGLLILALRPTFASSYIPAEMKRETERKREREREREIKSLGIE
jgi:hypothetical protein